MSDNQTPQHDPERDSATDPSVGGPASSSHVQHGESPVPPANQPQSTEGGLRPAMPPSSRRDRPGRVKHPAQSRKGVWAVVAVLCVAAGTVGSVLGAHAVARTDAAKARLAFHVTSAGIASTLHQAIEHEEDL